MAEFYMTNEGKIYRHRSYYNDWRLVSPNKLNENKIISDEEIKHIKGQKVNKNKANEELHKLWDNYNPVWTYNGKEYTSVKTDIEKLPYHFNKELHCKGFKLVMHNGELRWALVDTQYYPRVELRRVHGDIPPKVKISFKDGFLIDEEFAGWTHIRHLKGVECLNNGELI